jgi:hypothetical protein
VEAAACLARGKAAQLPATVMIKDLDRLQECVLATRKVEDRNSTLIPDPAAATAD